MKKIYYLTVDAVKDICQSTKSEKASQVKEYFRSVEYLLNKYYVYIINHFKEAQENILKNKNRKFKEPRRGIIYIYKDTHELQIYKVGMTFHS